MRGLAPQLATCACALRISNFDGMLVVLSSLEKTKTSLLLAGSAVCPPSTMPPHKKVEEQRTASERLRLVRLFRDDGKGSQRNFCKPQIISEGTFRGWLKDADSGKLSDATPAGPQGIRHRSSQFSKVRRGL